MVNLFLREESRLAYSQSNQYLAEAQKEEAIIIYHPLQQAQSVFQAGERDLTILLCAVQS
ncbi:MAG: pantoate--beta-alanine ligase [Coleofasciculaceae cyanobacterium]